MHSWVFMDIHACAHTYAHTDTQCAHLLSQKGMPLPLFSHHPNTNQIHKAKIKQKPLLPLSLLLTMNKRSELAAFKPWTLKEGSASRCSSRTVPPSWRTRHSWILKTMYIFLQYPTFKTHVEMFWTHSINSERGTWLFHASQIETHVGFATNNALIPWQMLVSMWVFAHLFWAHRIAVSENCTNCGLVRRSTEACQKAPPLCCET